MLFRSAAVLLPLAFFGACASSQGPAPAAQTASRAQAASDDLASERFAFLQTFAATYRFTHGQPKSIRVTPDGAAVLFLRSGPRSFVQDLYEFNTKTGEERVLLTAQQILAGGEEKLTAEELARRERMRMASRGIAGYELSKDGRLILVPLSGRLFVVERATGKSRELPSTAGFPIDPRFSPDASMVACVRDGDLYVLDAASGAERRLTTKTNDNVTHGLAEFVAQEEMDRFRGYWFSPDNTRLAVARVDTTGLETFHIADPMNPGKEPNTWPYPRPGKKNADVTLFLTPTAGGPTTPVEWDRAKYPYLASVHWSENAPLTILVQNREQTEQVLYAVDAASGSLTPLLRETDAAWLNLRQDCPKWLKDGSGFLWMSESSGEWRLELRNRDGTHARTLTPPNFGLRGLAHLAHDGATAYVTASDDPTQSHLWAVPINPAPSAKGAPVKLSAEPGQHSAAFSEKSDAMVRTSSLWTGRMLWSVVAPGGQAAGELKSVAEEPPAMPNVELVPLAGEHNFRAAVVRPRTFAPGKKWPVLLSVYGGPHAQVVTSARRAYLLQQWFADQGFIVVSLDGRGTPSRGRAWERAIRNDVITTPLDDQVAGLRQLAARIPEMDLDRVGIYGWSFGGYFSAMAAMRQPDVFKAACAGAPVADWLDYDTHYTERYLGLPDAQPEVYRANSVLTYAKDLRRPLLIIHGTADDNVYFMHSLKMTEALFKAGKDFEFLPLAGFTHMVPEPVVTTRLNARMADFFIRELK